MTKFKTTEMNYLRNALLLLLCGLAGDGWGVVVSLDLHVVNADLSPDGFTRPTVTAGGQFPCPLIAGNKSDNFQINVTDELTDTTMHRATSIHWHGIFQASRPEMDGTSFISQCPIVPNDSFLYNFTGGDQTGTYWYHSHLKTQYCDGLRGPLIIYDPEDPLAPLYDIDDETTIITLADWYHNSSASLFPNTNKVSPTPDSTLINGLGRWSGSTSDEPSPLAVVSATPGLRHRFRIINMSCYPDFTFSIDNHTLAVIEADGIETLPVVVDSIQIFAGQRYSVIVHTDQPVDNYWIRAVPSVGNSSTDGGLNSAILRYTGAPEADPTSVAASSLYQLNEYDLVPLDSPGSPGLPQPGAADYTLNIAIGKDAGSLNYTLNGAAFVPPSVPVLLQILSGATSANSIMPSGTVYTLPPGKVIEISIPGGGNHPFHLHGHNFDIIRTAGSSQYNFINPPRRDTVNIGATNDNVTFRFVTNNPGPWFLHCHMDWHLEAGMAVVFAEDAPDVKLTDGEADVTAWQGLCPLYDEMNPDGSLP